ncbi:hypothetical protein BDP67DRAFT_130130 [Colletotrichum lupini]|nr:hypothetical protein BDP67DRAFT_130130 [Colletotrichum lupini]
MKRMGFEVSKRIASNESTCDSAVCQRIRRGKQSYRSHLILTSASGVLSLLSACAPLFPSILKPSNDAQDTGSTLQEFNLYLNNYEHNQQNARPEPYEPYSLDTMFMTFGVFCLTTSSFYGCRCHDVYQDFIVSVAVLGGLYVLLATAAPRDGWRGLLLAFVYLIPPSISFGIWISIMFHQAVRRLSSKKPVRGL